MSDNADGGGGADHAQNSDQRLLIYEASRVSDVARELQDSASDLISRTWKEEQSLRQRALALDSDIRRLQSSLCSASKSPSFDSKLTEKIEEDIYRAKCLLSDGDVASLLPSKDHGRFLNMFLGPINVRATRKEVRLKVKEEYNSYRDRTAFLFLLFPSMLLFLRSWIWDGCFPALPVQLYQAWLLFLYTSLALRENILRVNGSDIRPWWVYHHYCAILMALVSLTWEIKGKPDCANKQKGVQLFLVWAIMQGIAMLLQNRYQRQRLYTRIALGKGFEAYVGMLLLRTAFVGVISEWQVVVCGVLLVVMAVGNFANTVETLMAKSRFKAMKRSKSKNDFDQLPSPTYFR
ncbi:hypothetical protein KFK09_000045 [Dendrobium nobile]|uniref:TMPIT-like protein n=1 Tax=Dendrobium nobile TaxID=94219 RepID=A0A8T3C7S0_DENNO|nr:hypothetical protein KFK09_000045 [Dendrobium nobile]